MTALSDVFFLVEINYTQDMKRILPLLTNLILAIVVLWSCQKAPEFTYSGPSSIELKADGSSTSISFTANRDWTVSTSDSWVSVSPSSGSASDGPISVSVSCNPNTTYEDRTVTVTIRMEEFTQVVTVFQPANKGIVLPTQSYNLASGARSIEVEVQANVEYSVSVSADWIKQTGTRGLVSRKLVFSVEENTSNNDREGRITIKALEGIIPDQVISVSQAGKDAIIVKDTSFDMPYGGGAVEVKVEANVEFEVKPGSDWIHYVQTRAMSTSTVCLSVDENLTYSSREGKVEIVQKGGPLSHTVKIKQAGRIAVTGIVLSSASLIMKEGESATLVASMVPLDAIPSEKVSWSSSDTQVATVDDGKVTAIKGGIATITASVDGYKADCSVMVTMDYNAVSISSLMPIEIMPFIGQVTMGDKQVYYHIEHLRLAEATRIRDMMLMYGAGQHSGEEYRELMDKLVVGMSNEAPSSSESYEVVGRGFSDLSKWGDNHSNAEWNIMNSIIPNTRRILEINGFYDAEIGGWHTEKPEQIDYINMESFLTENPNSIVILARSADAEYYDGYHEHEDDANIKQFCKSGRLIFFKSGGNIETHNGVLINKCFHKDVKADGHCVYSTQSIANGKNDEVADMALLVTYGTGPTGDVDQTGYIYESSLFPVGFHDKVLFAGRAFPEYLPTYDAYYGEGDHCVTSFTNYVNAAMMSLCFQMYSDAKDSFELLDMVRATCLTDYIRLDGESQPLQLINPAGLYKKYLTPQILPTAISAGETLNLDKGYYKGVIFSIPGAEVKINGEWVAFDEKNKDVIMSQNPMTLEWRLNGNLVRQYGFALGQTIEGQVITVDDKWGGLRLEVPMTFQLK